MSFYRCCFVVKIVMQVPDLIMDSIYQAILSSSQTLLGQVGRMLQAELGDFGPFWILLDEQRTVCAGDTKKLVEFVGDFEEFGRYCTQVDDGLEPVIWPTKNGVIAVGQFYTERTNCGYMGLVLPGYTSDTAQANMGLIEMLLGQLNLLLGMVEKNNLLHQKDLSRLSNQSPVLSKR
jgi:hypothetical protein